MIESYFKTLRDASFSKVEDFRPGSWINVSNATPQDLDKIVEVTGIEFHDLNDSLDKYEVPRIEHEESNILIFTRHPSVIEMGLYTQTLTIVLTPHHLITISPQKSDVVESILHGSPKLGTTQKSKLLFHVLLKITQEFNNSIKRVRRNVLEQEKEIENVDSESIVSLTKNEEILNQYLTSLVPLRSVLEAISSGRFVHLYEKDLDLLQDLMIAIKQSEDLCTVNVKSIRGLRDSYQIIFTNDVNKTIKRLTAITIIFTVPTIISSVYGMNVSLPMEKNPFAFIMIINLIFLIAIVLAIIFMKKKWL